MQIKHTHRSKLFIEQNLFDFFKTLKEIDTEDNYCTSEPFEWYLCSGNKNATSNNHSRVRVIYLFSSEGHLSQMGQRFSSLNHYSVGIRKLPVCFHHQTHHFLLLTNRAISTYSGFEDSHDSSVQSKPEESHSTRGAWKSALPRLGFEPSDLSYKSREVFCCESNASRTTRCPDALAAVTPFPNWSLIVVLTSWVTSSSESRPAELKPPPVRSKSPTCLRSTSLCTTSKRNATRLQHWFKKLVSQLWSTMVTGNT